eukprot:GHVT01088244.1.p1 GENE.GHVT01088244.1~~GHVT01088244.1.p1  ORF type:complete len:1023 (+),score=131.27 GHVT01088244.1:3018-6086(+)
MWLRNLAVRSSCGCYTVWRGDMQRHKLQRTRQRIPPRLEGGGELEVCEPQHLLLCPQSMAYSGFYHSCSDEEQERSRREREAADVSATSTDISDDAGECGSPHLPERGDNSDDAQFPGTPALNSRLHGGGGGSPQSDSGRVTKDKPVELNGRCDSQTAKRQADAVITLAGENSAGKRNQGPRSTWARRCKIPRFFSAPGVQERRANEPRRAENRFLSLLGMILHIFLSSILPIFSTLSYLGRVSIASNAAYSLKFRLQAAVSCVTVLVLLWLLLLPHSVFIWGRSFKTAWRFVRLFTLAPAASVSPEKLPSSQDDQPRGELELHRGEEPNTAPATLQARSVRQILMKFRAVAWGQRHNEYIDTGAASSTPTDSRAESVRASSILKKRIIKLWSLVWDVVNLSLCCVLVLGQIVVGTAIGLGLSMAWIFVLNTGVISTKVLVVSPSLRSSFVRWTVGGKREKQCLPLAVESSSPPTGMDGSDASNQDGQPAPKGGRCRFLTCNLLAARKGRKERTFPKPQVASSYTTAARLMPVAAAVVRCAQSSCIPPSSKRHASQTTHQHEQEEAGGLPNSAISDDDVLSRASSWVCPSSPSSAGQPPANRLSRWFGRPTPARAAPRQVNWLFEGSSGGLWADAMRVQKAKRNELHNAKHVDNHVTDSDMPKERVHQRGGSAGDEEPQSTPLSPYSFLPSNNQPTNAPVEAETVPTPLWVTFPPAQPSEPLEATARSGTDYESATAPQCTSVTLHGAGFDGRASETAAKEGHSAATPFKARGSTKPYGVQDQLRIAHRTEEVVDNSVVSPRGDLLSQQYGGAGERLDDSSGRASAFGRLSVADGEEQQCSQMGRSFGPRGSRVGAPCQRVVVPSEAPAATTQWGGGSRRSAGRSAARGGTVASTVRTFASRMSAPGIPRPSYMLPRFLSRLGMTSKPKTATATIRRTHKLVYTHKSKRRKLAARPHGKRRERTRGDVTPTLWRRQPAGSSPRSGQSDAESESDQEEPPAEKLFISMETLQFPKSDGGEFHN